MAAVVACGETPGDVCSDIKLIGNIAGGTTFSAYVAHGHDCGNYNQLFFRDNVAHSVEGTGAHIFKRPGGGNCMEVSYFSAYKVTLDGVVSYSNYQEIRHSHMIVVDSGMGPTM